MRPGQSTVWSSFLQQNFLGERGESLSDHRHRKVKNIVGGAGFRILGGGGGVQGGGGGKFSAGTS